MQPHQAWISKLRSWVAPNTGSGNRVCVYISGAAVASAIVAKDIPQDGVVDAELCAAPITELSDIESVLSIQLAQLNYHDEPCNLVLAPELYATHLIERPEVVAEELTEAVRWKLQDQVDFPVDTAVLDTFAMPEGASRHRNMIFAVALPQELLRRVVNSVLAAGVKKIASIDVTELALRNLSWLCFPQADQSVGLLRVSASSGMMTISRGEDLYLSRRISGIPADFSEAAWHEFGDRLLLQVQRSLDFYQSGMGQPECDMLMVACTQSWTPRVTEYLTEMLPIPVRALNEAIGGVYRLTLHNPEAKALDWGQLTAHQTNAVTAGLPALGGALRVHIHQGSQAA